MVRGRDPHQWLAARRRRRTDVRRSLRHAVRVGRLGRIGPISARDRRDRAGARCAATCRARAAAPVSGRRGRRHPAVRAGAAPAEHRMAGATPAPSPRPIRPPHLPHMAGVPIPASFNGRCSRRTRRRRSYAGGSASPHRAAPVESCGYPRRLVHTWRSSSTSATARSPSRRCSTAASLARRVRSSRCRRRRPPCATGRRRTCRRTCRPDPAPRFELIAW